MEISIALGPGHRFIRDWVMNDSPAFNRVFIPTSGSAFYRAPETEKELLPGNLYVLPSHLFYHVESVSFSVIFVDVLVTPELTNGLVCVPLNDHPVLSNIALVLYDLLLGGEIDSTLSDPLVRFLMEYLNTRGLITLSDDTVMTAVVRRIRRQHGVGVSVGELAKESGMNRVSFTKKFTRMFGVTPQQYILRMRMQEAMFMLLYGKSVGDTAHDLGYEDTKAFTYVFRKYCSIAPSMYRNVAHNKHETMIQASFLPPPPVANLLTVDEKDTGSGG